MLILLAVVPSCSKQDRSGGKRVIVVGFDGMDPKLTGEMMADGRLPNFRRLWEQGGFCPLQTVIPPQSPVAWSTMVTGLNPGGHGLFDFIHRDPAPPGAAPIRPRASYADKTEDRWVIPNLLGYRLPLLAGKERLLRHGKPFWEYLTEAGIPARVLRMPANYPAKDSKGAEFSCLTDMGTPDLKDFQGGTFSYYTSDPKERYRKIEGGGKLYPLLLGKKDTGTAVFYGPDNTLRAEKKEQRPVQVPFSVWRDPEDPVVRIAWQDQMLVLHEGEWSEWYPIKFDMIPHLATMHAVCRIFLKEVHPNLKFYVSPFNFDPLREDAPISAPAGFAAQVAQVTGRFYTQGLPEDTEVLTLKVLSRPQFLEQADLVYQERMKLLDYALDHFASGLLFIYFGGTDLVGHAFWGARTPNHPALTPEEQERYAHEMERIYQEADQALGKVLERSPEATILVLSDHGFETFTRGLNLNTWLSEAGYLKRKYASEYGMALNIDFEATKAYALGINGLYVNLKGREKCGIVDPADKQTLLDDIRERLLALVDPQTGERVVKEVYQCDRVYSGPYVSLGPDLQIGYDRSYRGSWSTVLGGVPKEVLEDNTQAWCADHCIAADLVPGILLANRPIRTDRPALVDIAPTILAEFGVPIPKTMEGRSVFTRSEATAYAR